MILQACAYAVVSASLIALLGVGFQIVFRVGKFFHFAHGALFAVAPYLLYAFGRWLHAPGWISVVLSLLASIILGLAMEFFCYQPIRKAGGSSKTLFLSSLGILIVIQSAVALVFGNEPRSLRLGPVTEGMVLGVRLTVAQLSIVVGSLVCLLSTWIFMHFTSLGKRLEAVANDPELAHAFGIDVDRMHLMAIGLGSALAAVAGILMSWDVDMTPTMGIQPLLMCVVAVIIGGNTLVATAGGALFLAVAQHLGVLWLSSRWQDAIVFVILIFFLLIRPYGITGRPLRKAVV